MKKYSLFLLMILFISLNSIVSGQTPGLYYKFQNNPNATTTPNCGFPLLGTATAGLTSLTLTPGGQFDTCITSIGTSGAGVGTGWNCDLGTDSWTISMWVEIPSNTTGSACYLFGDGGSGSFRCFHNGVAGQDNLLLRGNGITDVTVTGIGPAATVVTFVYDATVPDIKAYKNGVLAVTVPQTALNVVTGTGFKVGGYGSSASFVGKMDEFRLYKRALSAAEVLAMYNQDSPCGNPNYALLLPSPGVNTNYVSIPNTAAMTGFSNLTIEAWVKVGSTSTANTILNKGASSFDYQLGITSAGLPFVRLQGVIATSTGYTITAGVWTHVAATFDGTNVMFYKDGALICTIPCASTIGTSSGEMRIGRGNNDPGSGDIEELRLWSVARSGADISTDRCKKWPSTFTSTTGLLALWHFDNNLEDSISSFNGTSNGTTSFDMFTYPDPSMSCVGVGIIPDDVVSDNALLQNYPNPFEKNTIISYQINSRSNVVLAVYDILGNEVCTLVNTTQNEGKYEVKFDASSLNAGIYLYKLTTNGKTEIKRMMLAK